MYYLVDARDAGRPFGVYLFAFCKFGQCFHRPVAFFNHVAQFIFKVRRQQKMEILLDRMRQSEEMKDTHPTNPPVVKVLGGL